MGKKIGKIESLKLCDSTWDPINILSNFAYCWNSPLYIQREREKKVSLLRLAPRYAQYSILKE